MTLQFLDTALWAAGPVLNAALFGVLWLRHRVRTFPVLAAWCLFTILSAIALFLIYRMDVRRTYAIAYLTVDALDALFQIGVVAEVARIGFDAMLKGQADVVAGLSNKMQVVLSKVMPSQALAATHRKLAEPND